MLVPGIGHRILRRGRLYCGHPRLREQGVHGPASLRACCMIAFTLAALFVQSLALAPPARADDLADFHTAVRDVTGQYDFALEVLKTGSQQDTAAAVQDFRQSWEQLVERFGMSQRAAFLDSESGTAIFTDMGLRLVGVLLIIELGRREAVGAALAPIGDTLARLAAHAPQR